MRIAASDAKELVELLLEMKDEESRQLLDLYQATLEARASGETPKERQEAVGRVLDEDPRLRAAYRALTGQDGSHSARLPPMGA